MPALAAPFALFAFFWGVNVYRRYSEAVMRPPETPRPFMFAVICTATAVGFYLFASRIFSEVSQDFPLSSAVVRDERRML